MTRPAHGLFAGRSLAGCLLPLTGLLVLCASAFGQSRHTANTLQLDDPNQAPPAKIDQLAWLAGHWQGESQLGIAQEMWMPPSAGTMAGTFKVVQNNKIFFYEFLEISERNGSLVYRVKHFDANLHGWEDKDKYVTFELVKIGAQEVFFGGLTYRRIDHNKIHAFVSIEHEGGKPEEIEFVMQRQNRVDEARYLRKEIIIKAPLADVWKTWTSADGLKSVSRLSKVELKTGGKYEWFLDLEPDERGKRGGEGNRILAFMPNEMLAFDWSFPPSIPSLRASGAKTQVVVRFETLGDDFVRIDFAQHGWQEGYDWDAGYAYFDNAWDWVLQEMKRHLEE